MPTLPASNPTPITPHARTISRPSGGISRFAPEPRRLVVGIVAAYPSMRAGLGALVQNDRSLTPAAIAPAAIAAASGMPALGQIGDADVILVEPNDLDQETLGSLITMAKSESVPVLWLASHAVPENAVPANGPGGVISPDAGADTVVAAIRAVQVGLRVIDPSLGDDSSTTQVSGEFHNGGTDLLSPREREVLELVATGLPNKAIAHALGISDHTVKFHVSSLLNKLGAASRTEAVTLATRQGILSL